MKRFQLHPLAQFLRDYDHMRIAVVCSCFKRLSFTRLCLPLAMRNAGMDAAWRFCDDGSADGTAKFLDSLVAKNVTIVNHLENAGMFARRNEGLRWGLEQGADIIVSMDNDLLLPYGWLRDLIAAMGKTDIGVGGPWMVNDVTIMKMLRKKFPDSLNGDFREWVPTGVCGGTCAAHKAEVLNGGCWYQDNRPSWTYGDSVFNGLVRSKGFRIGIYLGIQAWRLERIIWADPEIETEKLRTRHQHITGNLEGFEKSLAREMAKVIVARAAT